MSKKPNLLAVLLVLVIGGLILSSWFGNSGLPRAGDTVSPRLVQEIHWEAGQEGELWVDLAATSPAGKSRRLSFAASPSHNPIAHVSFYDDGGEPIAPSIAELSQRC